MTSCSVSSIRFRVSAFNVKGKVSCPFKAPEIPCQEGCFGHRVLPTVFSAHFPWRRKLGDLSEWRILTAVGSPLVQNSSKAQGHMAPHMSVRVCVHLMDEFAVCRSVWCNSYFYIWPMMSVLVELIRTFVEHFGNRPCKSHTSMYLILCSVCLLGNEI